MISQLYRSASILAAKKLWTPVTLVHGAKALAGSLGTLTCLSLLKQKWHADARGTSMKKVRMLDKATVFCGLDHHIPTVHVRPLPELNDTTNEPKGKPHSKAIQCDPDFCLSTKENKMLSSYRDPITMILYTSLHDCMLSCCALCLAG